MTNKVLRLMVTPLLAMMVTACTTTPSSSVSSTSSYSSTNSSVASSTSSTLPVASLVYATIEINPGIGLMINEQNRVSYAHALNADGEMVMLQLALENQTLDDAIKTMTQEMLALKFVATTTIGPTANLDAIGSNETAKTQVRNNIQTRITNEFAGAMITMQTQTRTYTQAEMDEANAKGTTPLKLRLVKQAMIGDNNLLENEALALNQEGLLEKAKNGAVNMKQIASTLAADFVAERHAIQDTYKADIQALKDQIAAAIASSEDTTALEAELATLRATMVAEIQALVVTFRQQSVQARSQWQTEADNRRGGGSSASSQSGNPSTSSPGSAA
jgi:hypothetical protein